MPGCGRTLQTRQLEERGVAFRVMQRQVASVGGNSKNDGWQTVAHLLLIVLASRAAENHGSK